VGAFLPDSLLSFDPHIRASNLKNEIPFELANGNSRIGSQKVYGNFNQIK